MKNKLIAGAGLAACLGAWASDPVIMTVDGTDVPKSEFEYLYHKNSQQQLAPQPLEEYVEMFKIYKLKVADAKAEGIDTTAAFIREMAQYRNDLSAPYMTDSTYLNSLVREAYERSKQEAEAYHIMVSKGRTPAENAAARHRADSLHAAVAAGADFAQTARDNSQDRSAKTNAGYLGWVSTGRFPYDFETAVFETPEGVLAQVVESPVAYHVIKGGRKRPARGSVQASHIMKAVSPDADPAAQAAAKAAIDSLYRLVSADPDKFAAVAAASSDDKGSARNGGQLPWFGAGEMVAPFDSAAFALPVGGISEPVRSQFGWHVIYKAAERPVPSLQEMKSKTLERMTNPQDDRYRRIRAHESSILARKHKGSVNAATVDALKTRSAVNGLDSLFYNDVENGTLASLQLFTIDRKAVPASGLASYMRRHKVEDKEAAAAALDKAVEGYYASKLAEAEQTWLEANRPEYRNLLNEYRDGSLLYEVSVRKVWDKASKDTEGLERYFDSHRGDYTWTEPHAKGLLIRASNDSVADAVRQRLASTPADSLSLVVRKEFAGKASADRILKPRGADATVDWLMFGGAEPESKGTLPVVFMYEGRVLTAPEEVADVRGMVTSDYQNQLEAEWVADLKARYPVEVYPKVLKKVK